VSKPNDIDSLTKQLEKMAINQAQLEARIANLGNSNFGSSPSPCFICDTTDHRLGVRNCPEVPKLINENLASYGSNGRLNMSDGSELPKVRQGTGGIANLLRAEQAASSKGKARDYPPHQTLSVDLVVDGVEPLTGDVYAISAEENWAYSYPATRSEKTTKDARYDPKKKHPPT
jgi:hypothetical protein